MYIENDSRYSRSYDDQRLFCLLMGGSKSNTVQQTPCYTTSKATRQNVTSPYFIGTITILNYFTWPIKRCYRKMFRNWRRTLLF